MLFAIHGHDGADGVFKTVTVQPYKVVLPQEDSIRIR